MTEDFPAPDLIQPYRLKITIGTGPGAVIEIDQPTPIQPEMLEGTMEILARALGAGRPAAKPQGGVPAGTMVAQVAPAQVYNPRFDPRQRAQYERDRPAPASGENGQE